VLHGEVTAVFLGFIQEKPFVGADGGICLLKLVVCIVTTRNLKLIRYIQGVPGGICQTSGECSLC